MSLIRSPYPLFTDIDGQPLENGYITFDVPVYWDSDFTSVASGIRTKGGYPINGDSVGALYTAATEYTITVKNKKGYTVYTSQEVDKISGTTKVLWTGPLSTVGVETSLDSGESFGDWDMIRVYFHPQSDTQISRYLTVEFSPSVATDGSAIYFGKSPYDTMAKLSDTTFSLLFKNSTEANICRIEGIKL